MGDIIVKRKWATYEDNWITVENYKKQHIIIHRFWNACYNKNINIMALYYWLIITIETDGKHEQGNI